MNEKFNNIEKVKIIRRKEKSLGKFLGTIAFFVSETIAILAVVAVVFNAFMGNGIDGKMIADVLFFQGSVLAITWGSKATSNFAKKYNYDKE